MISETHLSTSFPSNVPFHFNSRDFGAITATVYVIGFTNVYYTLWQVTRGKTGEHCYYLQNLSMDFGQAQQKAAKYGSVEIDLDLRGDEGKSFYRPLKPAAYAPDCFCFSMLAGVKMRDCDPNEVYKVQSVKVVIGYQSTFERVEKKVSGLLWATYLNKAENTIRGLRRRLIARECLVNGGLLIKVGRKYLTPDQIKRQDVQSMIENALNGHHEVDGKRVSMKVQQVGGIKSFEGLYGTTYLTTFIDDQGRLFKYMGSKNIELPEGEFTEIKATIKHDNYKEQLETKLQRIKIS